MPRFIQIALAVYLGSQAVESARLGYSGWQFARHNTEAAAEISPGNAVYHAAADPARAARLSPRDASLKMRLGLWLEESGRSGEGEQALLEAAKLSRKYEPRWTLAGFYFRQNKTEPFWFWAREAAAVAYRDPEPLFDLAWTLEPDGAAIRSRLALDARPAIWRAWVLHAARRGHFDELAAILDRVSGIDPQPIADALLAGGRVQALTRLNGHRAFDWQAIPQEGVRFENGQGFTLPFDGRQPAECDVATRILPAPLAQTAWPIEGAADGLSWRTEPFGRDGARVTLHYRRPVGETRVAGVARVRE